jgi:hypothetical protein
VASNRGLVERIVSRSWFLPSGVLASLETPWSARAVCMIRCGEVVQLVSACLHCFPGPDYYLVAESTPSRRFENVNMNKKSVEVEDVWWCRCRIRCGSSKTA